MKALKTAVTLPLAALLLAAGLAAEALALARLTVLDADFYGKNERAVYEFIGEITVRRMADAVLEYAPAAALRTTNREQAEALALRALPPGKVADMLEAGGPDIARYLISGGDVPVLRGSQEFARGEEAVVRGLLLDGVWDMLPQKPAFPAFMPFTPEWNLNHAAALSQALRLPHWYLSLADHAGGLVLSALVMLAGALYLLWIRERKPFFAVCGAALTVNGLLLAALVAVASYFTRPVAEAAAVLYPVSEAANLLGADFPELVRIVLASFRPVLSVASLVSVCFGITLFTMGIGSEKKADAPHQNDRLKGVNSTRHVPKHRKLIDRQP